MSKSPANTAGEQPGGGEDEGGGEGTEAAGDANRPPRDDARDEQLGDVGLRQKTVDDQDHRGHGDADTGLDQQDAEVLAADRVIGKHVVLEKLAAQQHALDADGRVQQYTGGKRDHIHQPNRG